MNSKYPDNSTDLRGSNVGRKEVVEKVSQYMTGVIYEALDFATRTCLNCEHFREKEGEVCSLNNKVPPPTIAARGCECYEDRIPF